MGDPDLSPDDRRGLVIFPADGPRSQPETGEQWWLVLLALALAVAMIAVAFAIR